MNRIDRRHYDPVSQALHWLTAIVVTIAFILGPGGFERLMRQGVDPATRAGIVWHESLGVVVLALTGLRLLWVWLRPAPPQIEIDGRLRLTARIVHGALWVLLFATPIAAFLTLGGEGYPLTLLGGVRVERMPLIAESAIAHLADWGDVHEFLGDTLIWLAGLHAAAALFHHLVLKDGVLRSMLPPGKPR